MTVDPPVPRYGVRMASRADDAIEEAAESIGLLGYCVVDSGMTQAEIAALRDAFDRLFAAQRAGDEAPRLEALGEADVVRCPLALEPGFLDLASNPRILQLCGLLLGPRFILNQQNALVNPAGPKAYSQSAYHRDLPYQHFVSSRPLAINALFCLDAFTMDNGATFAIPASHRQEAFPSDPVVRAQARQIEAPAGSFLVLDCMTFHAGGTNHSPADRRAVNNVYSIALLRQQIDLPAYLGDSFTSAPELRQLLGFDHPTARSPGEYVAQRSKKAGPAT